MKHSLALVALLTVLSASAAAEVCHLEGTYIGDVDRGRLRGIPVVAPVFRYATTNCARGVETMPVIADPSREPLVAHTWTLEQGRAYRLELRSGAAIGTHRVEAVSDATLATEGADIPAHAGPLRKAGNGVPRCTQNRWRDEAMPVQLEVYADGAESVVAGATDDVRWAAEVWSAVACSSAAIAITTTPIAQPLSADGRNTLQWETDDDGLFATLGGGHVGITCHVCDEDGFFVETDVRLNAVDRDWSTLCDGAGFDAFGVALHEMGHVLGLGHLDDALAVMHGLTSVRRSIAVRLLRAGDIAPLCMSYPCVAGDCSAQIDAREGCPAGVGLCGDCVSDADCGADGDRCVSPAGGRSYCARACSVAYPCPAGFVCSDVEASAQCIPADGVCPDLASVVGCGCLDDGACGVGGACTDGRCEVPCDGDVACPNGASCVPLFNDDGAVVAARCLADADAPDPCEVTARRGCGGCTGAGGLGGSLGFALAIWVPFMRRRKP